MQSSGVSQLSPMAPVVLHTAGVPSAGLPELQPKPGSGLQSALPSHSEHTPPNGPMMKQASDSQSSG